MTYSVGVSAPDAGRSITHKCAPRSCLAAVISGHYQARGMGPTPALLRDLERGSGDRLARHRGVPEPSFRAGLLPSMWHFSATHNRSLRAYRRQGGFPCQGPGAQRGDAAACRAAGQPKRRLKHVDNRLWQD